MNAAASLGVAEPAPGPGSALTSGSNPTASRRAPATGFTRSSKRPHRFRVSEDAGVEVHQDFGRLDPPDELYFGTA
jgi:hypothetical protein